MIWKEILSSNSNRYGGDREDRSGQWIEARPAAMEKTLLENEKEGDDEKKEMYEMIIELEPLTAKIYEVVG